ncbi:MAG: GntR family transcriptional regulator [Anaerolineales bacterium]|nr:GntR family transcriptional regulator [Anaerolineales bacterium]
MPHFPFQRLQSELAIIISNTPAGERLPSEPDLAKQLGVSRATLREAMRTFETQGLIRRRQGAGTFVVGRVPVMESGLEVLESLDTLSERLGLSLSVANLMTESIYAEEDHAEGLEVPLATRLIRVQRVMRTDNRPVAYLVDILPEDILKLGDLPNDFRGSVLDFLIERGDPLTVSRTNVSALGAAADVAKALEIQRGDVLLHFISRLFTANGRVADISNSYFIPGYFHFHIVRRVGMPGAY